MDYVFSSSFTFHTLEYRPVRMQEAKEGFVLTYIRIVSLVCCGHVRT